MHCQITVQDSISAQRLINKSYEYIGSENPEFYFVVDSALKIFKRYCIDDMSSYSYSILASHCYLQNRYYESKVYLDSAEAYLNKTIDIEVHNLIDFINTKNVILSEIQNPLSSINDYYKILGHQEFNHIPHDLKSTIYTNLASELRKIEDYTNSEYYYLKSQKNCSGKDRAKNYIGLLKLFCASNQLSKAKLQLSLLEKDPNFDNYINIIDPKDYSSLYRTISTTHLLLKNYQKAKSFIDMAIKHDTSSFSRASSYHRIGQINEECDSFDLALRYYRKSADLFNKLYNYSSNSESAKAWNSLLRISSFLSRPRDSLLCLLDSLEKYNMFPNGEYLIQSYRLVQLKTKASISPSLPLLSQAVQLIHEMRNDIRSLDSKIESSKRAREIYNLAVPDALKQFKKTDSSHYFDLAFYWADLSKGGVLSEQIARDRIIRRYENDTLYQHYVELTSDIHALRKQIIDQKNNPDHQLALTEAQELIIQKRQELKQIEDITDFNHHLIKPNEFISSKLNNASATLQVYKSDSSYFFLIHLADGTKHYNQVDITSLNPLLLKHLNYQSSDQIDTEDFLNNAQTLYQIIFPENINWEDQHHLTIVPDGLFHQLSVESLVLPDTDLSLKSANYLFKNVPISYSLGLHLTKPFQKNQTNSSVLAVAPNFKSQQVASQRDCSEEVFGSLTCNTEEVEFIASIYDGRSFLHDNATVENFTSSVDQHQIIHLATHACIDTTNYYKSAIVFNDGQILMSDLYNLDWQNKTVVLSACNTAHGSEVSGEGVFNFARTLTELGCKEVVVSLWPIDDCSTAKFIKDFYSLRKKYHHTPLALQKARSRFIKNSDKLHSMPLFWAPLIVISNDQNVGITVRGWSISQIVMSLLLVCVVLGTCVWLYRRRGKSMA